MTKEESKGINPLGENYEMIEELRDDREQKDQIVRENEVKT